MDFTRTVVIWLSVLQVIGAGPLLLTGGKYYRELAGVKKSLASLRPLEEDMDDDMDDSDDVSTWILKANEGSDMQLQEGDVAVTSERSTTPCVKCLWPKSSSGEVIVPYTLSPDFGENHRTLITRAMKELMTLSCIRFVDHTTEKSYLNIQSADGCWSYVGRVGGKQALSVSKRGCMLHGVVQHEILHSLGFFHEHVRSDRDDYVDIMYQYIIKGQRNNFGKKNTNNLGLPYDYSSVMHYGRSSFSNTRGKATIVPKPDPTVPIGQRSGLSVMDVTKLNTLYDCDVCSTLLTRSSGTLTSANYPSAYPNDSNCVWLIRIASGKISLVFNTFNIQKSTNCESDYIKVYDGLDRTSPVLLDKTCGSRRLQPIESSGRMMLVEFVSNRAGTATGFMASYSKETNHDNDDGDDVFSEILKANKDKDQVALITAAMQEFEILTCVKFVHRSEENDYLSITSKRGCWSSVGRMEGAQELSLSTSGCIRLGTIQHELNHALGFHHEQSRSDRNNYVTINTQYIDPEHIQNFRLEDTNNLGLEYDYSSVMHYPSNAFSNTSGKMTIVPKPDPTVHIGQRYGLSTLDIAKINRLYHCDVCSTFLSAPNGTLNSANYPSRYPHNSSCVWLIRIPKGQVLLKFHAFDVQPSPECSSDYVTVYDGASRTSPVLLERTCGAQQLPMIIASSNLMLVEFVTDGELAATGFKASYSTYSTNNE
ncbi:dorsal-ventral patterning tolloid-like protein 1 [Rhinophrynus dorsalis]